MYRWDEKKTKKSELKKKRSNIKLFNKCKLNF